MTATRWCDEQLELGEGPRWVDGRLVLANILAGRLYEHAGTAPGPLTLVAKLDVPLGAVAPVSGMPGEWIAAAGTGIARLVADGSLRWLDRPEDVHDGRTRMNDGVCDPAGRFWAGSMAVDSEDRLWIAIWGGNAVRCYDAEGTLLFTLDAPTPQLTSVCILDDRLVVTTARFGLPEPKPNAGRLFAFEIPGLRAQPAAPYRQQGTHG